MWLFENPKDYPTMLKKIAWTTFFMVLIGEIIFSYCSDKFATVLEAISFGIKYESNGLNFYISYLYAPFLFAIFENVFKLHDRISDFMRIRYFFDKFVIIRKSLQLCSLLNSFSRITYENRNDIMRNIFYKYAGYVDPVIDSHLIYMALGSWSWVWIILDTTLITIILGGGFLFYSFSWFATLVIFCIIVLLLLLMLLIIRSLCQKYALREVEEILDDDERKKNIVQYLSKI